MLHASPKDKSEAIYGLIIKKKLVKIVLYFFELKIKLIIFFTVFYIPIKYRLSYM